MLYESFNLIIESKDIYLPELPLYEGNRAPNIIIKEKKELSLIKDKIPIYTSKFLKIYQNQLILSIDNIGLFKVSNGSHIYWCKEKEGVKDQEIRNYLLGSALGAILIQKDYLILHANSLTKDDRTIICLGKSGVGKSTLAFSLMKRGWTLISDDLVAIDNNQMVLPGIPRIKLSKDAIEHYSLKFNEVKKFSTQNSKYVFTSKSFSKANKPKKLTDLFILTRKSDHDIHEDFNFKQITKENEKCFLIKKNLFRPKYVRYHGKEGQVFLKIINLVKELPVSILSFPNNKKSIDLWSRSF